MRSEVVRLRKRIGPQRAEPWHGRALANRPFGNRSAAVIVLFPERLRATQARADAPHLVTSLELENLELRRQVVELALQIQELKERRR
jgi:hypothetical protein